jgi:hypothetical protein
VIVRQPKLLQGESTAAREHTGIGSDQESGQELIQQGSSVSEASDGVGALHVMLIMGVLGPGGQE